MSPTFLSHPVHFNREEFRRYVATLHFSEWKPKLLYLHNTGVPSLKQWTAMGTTPQERWGANLNRYYQGLGWHAGPHAVACPDYIWVLCDFTHPGVAQSCSNTIAWALEMVGNYEVGGDDFVSGEGAKVRDNSAFALAVIAEHLGLNDLADFAFNTRGLHFHRDCKADHHACPGSKVMKPEMLARIGAFRTALAAKPLARAPESPATTCESKIAGVEDIQSALNRLGVAPEEPVDGAYGPLTKARVAAFQMAGGLDVDGWAGPITCKAIIDALAA